MTTSYDVIVIGSGAGGGTLAHRLAPSGKRVLIVERGGWLPREPGNWDTADVFVEGRYISADTWYDDHDHGFQPQVHYYVGGATKLYGAALYRLRAEDFGELRHHDGVSPAWPISYGDIEPYYTQAEALYQVHGARGEDPTEPPASADYPFPALAHEPRIQQLADDLASAGYHPFHAPCGVLRDEANPPYSTCVRCGRCDGFPCPLHAKSDAEVMAVRPALLQPNVSLLTGARAVRLETDAAGRTVTGVVVEVDGGVETLTADVVVVSCGAANTAKLLLASASDTPPGRPGQRVRSGRAQLHVPQQPGRAGAVARAQPHRVPEDARPQRLLPVGRRGRRRRLPARQHPDGRQVPGRDVPGREAAGDPAGADLRLARHRRPCGRLLALDRGPAPARQPGHADRGRRRPDRLHAHERGPGPGAVPQAPVDARAPRHAPGPPHPPPRLPARPRSRWPGWPTRPAPAGSAPTPPRRCSTSSAAPTSSTTSMSSTPASSRASGR